MEFAKILHEVVLPNLLEHEGFKEALQDAASQILITELKAIVSELPEGKSLTIGTLPEASNNVLANTIVGMIVTLKDAVEAHAKFPKQLPSYHENQEGICKCDG